jgi:hypothetical protein
VNPSPELIVAAVSAVLSLGAGLIGARANKRAKQLDFELERQRKQEDAAEVAQRILHMYRDPLLDAAQNLQSRSFNIVANGYLASFLHCGVPEEERYAREYTVFAIAEYLTWVEIVRREVRFLDLGDEGKNRELMALLMKTQLTIQSDKLRGPFRIFRGHQRAIAEVMMVPTGATEGPRSECLGYASFRDRLDEDPDFRGWFDRLLADVDKLVIRDQDDRVIQLQHDLVDLLDHLDPKMLRIPQNFRQRLNQVSPVPIPVPAQHTPR